MLNRLIAACFLTFIGISSICFFIIALAIRILTGFFDRRLVLLHLFTSFWASLYLWMMPCWVVVRKGREKIRKEVTYVVVSNHQSLLDILVAFSMFFHFKWVSKAEIFTVPLIGWNMVLNRYIRLVRGNKESIEKMFNKCEKTLVSGSSVYFFPEGTRSKTGELKPFKTGAFQLAKKLKLPILPIAINGTKDALPKHSLNYHGRYNITIEILDEIPVERILHLSEEKIAEMARSIIAEHVHV